MGAEYLYAAAYLVCAAIAVGAARSGRPSGGGVSARPFWIRISIVSGLFAILRVLGAHKAVSHAVNSFNHAEGLQQWQRPDPYLMLVAAVAGGIAVAGLLVFRRRVSRNSIVVAASAIVGLVLLALAHSLSLYLPKAILEAELGQQTISRILEGLLLLALGASGLRFIADEKRVGGRRPAQALKR